MTNWDATIVAEQAAEIAKLKARIAELEGLDELLAEYSWVARDRNPASQTEARRLAERMKAILKRSG